MDAITSTDLLIIGGGINGTGIARDAAGRGLKVVLCEQDDLGAATSSASSKLIHGGLRYLEQYAFRLVHEALAEREVLLRAAPHLIRPMRFVMPYVPGLRPAWVIRAGLLLYDCLARRQTLPGSHGVDLRTAPYGSGLKPGLNKGFAYSDCWVDDARLVIANARAAADLGAGVHPRTVCAGAKREGASWRVTLRTRQGRYREVMARALVNAAGPWVTTVLDEALGQASAVGLRLVKGSHIAVPRIYDAHHAFILQNDDGRVVFAYPYQERYTLIGTTDVEHTGAPGSCSASEAEIAYLCRAVNRYFDPGISPSDVVWSYCGIRPLFDDGSSDPARVTRDYMLRVDGDRNEAPLLSVFGGKITTYRRLAEHALERLAPWFEGLGRRWTAAAPLPGGDLVGPDLDAYIAGTAERYPALPAELLGTLVRRHGSGIDRVLSDVRATADLGTDFGAGLYAREIDYFIDREWALTAEDVLWRRSKCGLHMNLEQKQAVEHYILQRHRQSYAIISPCH